MSYLGNDAVKRDRDRLLGSSAAKGVQPPAEPRNWDSAVKRTGDLLVELKRAREEETGETVSFYEQDHQVVCEGANLPAVIERGSKAVNRCTSVYNLGMESDDPNVQRIAVELAMLDESGVLKERNFDAFREEWLNTIKGRQARERFEEAIAKGTPVELDDEQRSENQYQYRDIGGEATRIVQPRLKRPINAAGEVAPLSDAEPDEYANMNLLFRTNLGKRADAILRKANGSYTSVDFPPGREPGSPPTNVEDAPSATDDVLARVKRSA